MKRRAKAAAPKRQSAQAGLGFFKQPGYGSASQGTMRFTYVYILRSLAQQERFYVGLTDDLKERLNKHNLGEVPHTSKYRPWTIKTAVAFGDAQRAVAFERYLKTASGRAFASKRL